MARIIISKTNQIGDVVFALPMSTAIKQTWPDSHIIFLGRGYTSALIEHYQDVDETADWDAISNLPDDRAIEALKALRADTIIHVHPNKRLAYLARRAGIKARIGTIGRFYHWLTCNRFVRVSRKNSPLHETQLDMQYLKALGLKSDYSLAEIIALRRFKPFKLTSKIKKLLDPKKFNLILHPKTRGEHIEWPLSDYAALIAALPQDQFHILVTGSVVEGDKIREQVLTPFSHVTDLCGKLSLEELQILIAHADGLIASSTGPVHLAAAFGIHTLGLYAPIKPFDAGRWGPVGKKAQVLSVEKNCDWCRDLRPCRCVGEISVEQVKSVVMGWL